MSYENPASQNNGKFTAYTTPKGSGGPDVAIMPPRYVVPIIFIPGIMGSNVADNSNNQVWFPPNGIGSSVKAAFMGAFFRNAGKRQRELNPESTHVSNMGEVDVKGLQQFNKEKAYKRGWGTVWWKGYGPILHYLEKNLNQALIVPNAYQQSLNFIGTAQWEKIVATGDNEFYKKGLLEQYWNTDPTHKAIVDLLKKDTHEELADYAFPVFALGYNWLQSNDDSARDIAERLNKEVMPQIQSEFPKSTFKKFIIVTHSMGGLVTRALIQEPAVKDKILGVVHGVMPASGAPTVYQRFCNGWDGYNVTGNILDWAAKYVFGASSETLTPVLGNSCGGLQLLPFANFNGGKPWLTLKAKNKRGETVVAQLPKKGNPYEEIYTRTNVWWSMINPKYLDPAGILQKQADKDGKSDITDYYLKNIDVVKEFHTKIADSYHPNTYAHYGNDEEHKAFSEVVWETQEQLDIETADDLIEYSSAIRTLKKGANGGLKDNSTTYKPISKKDQEKMFKDDGKRVVTRNGKKTTFELRIKPTSSGDGTVCYESGADVHRVKLKGIFVIKGCEHSASYGTDHVQLNTLYSITKVMEEIL